VVRIAWGCAARGVAGWVQDDLWLRRGSSPAFLLVPSISPWRSLVFGVVDGLQRRSMRAICPLRHGGPPARPSQPGVILLVGVVATNVLGKRVLQRGEGYLLRIPVFRTVYAPVKQLVLAFSPDNEYGFKRVVMIRTESRGYILASNQGVLHPVGHAPSAHHVMSLPIISIRDVVICWRTPRFFQPEVEEGMRVLPADDAAGPARTEG
jgi:hypothetical protein